MNYIVKIDGMGCGHCIKRIECALGDLGASIDKVVLGEAIFSYDGDEAAVREAIEDLGFDVVSVSVK